MSYFWNKSGLVFAGALAVGCFSDQAASASDVATDQVVTNAGTLISDSSGSAAVLVPVDAGGIALRAELLGDANLDSAVFDFYAARAFRLFWLETPARERALRETLATAPDHALPTSHYETQAMPIGIATTDPVAMARAEIALSRAYLAFVGDVAAGVLQPRSLDREIHVFPERPSVAVLLQEAKLTGDPSEVVARFQPSHPHYGRVREMIATLNAIIDGGDWGSKVGEGGSLKLGMSGPRVSALRARLIAMNDMAAPPANVDTVALNAPVVVADVYDAALETGVIAFQRRHGLNADGVAGRRTISAVNVSAAQRRDQAVATLERLRWMNKDLGAEHVFVNLADFRVNVIKNGTVVFDERVVVGKNRKFRTPEFTDMMTYLVLNPSWNVPRSIATKEILPELQANPNYLAEKNMELVGVGGEIPPDPMLADWSLYDRSSFPFRVRQRPGTDNALGRVKFMFPNQFSIYLHDTPSKRLFAKDARAFSHGCVRVQDPMQLARVLLAPKYDDPAAAIERILETGTEAYVNLVEPLPVHLSYRTAWVDDAGVMQFRADVYGRDALIRSALGELGVTGRPGA